MISLSIQDLKSRGLQVAQILNPLVESENGPKWDFRSKTSQVTIIAHGGKSSRLYRSRVKDSKFQTACRDCVAGYMEVWRRSSEDDRIYLLALAYLDISVRNENTKGFDEIICLHADPDANEDDESYLYKRGPHIHVSAATDPIPKSHIALELSNNDQILTSLDYFNTVFARSVTMIRDEILYRLTAN